MFVNLFSFFFSSFLNRKTPQSGGKTNQQTKNPAVTQTVIGVTSKYFSTGVNEVRQYSFALEAGARHKILLSFLLLLKSSLKGLW